MPPARETTSGREATANRARISEAVIPAVRWAYDCFQGSRREPCSVTCGLLTVRAECDPRGRTRRYSAPSGRVVGRSEERRVGKECGWRWWTGRCNEERKARA